MSNTKFQFGKIQVMKLSSGGNGYGGTVKIPRLLPETKIRLNPNADKRGDSSPDYWIEAPDKDENGLYWAGAGAAWVKEPADGGDKFLSLTVDLADMPQAINCAAFPADNEDQPKDWTDKEKPVVWRIVYSRARRRKSPEARAAIENVRLNDEIKY